MFSLFKKKNYCHEGSIIFFHIPKAAGTSFSHLLECIYTKKRCFKISGINNEFDLIHFKRLSIKERTKFKAITGHRALLLTDFIPQHKILITFLREPLKHTLSSFNYIKQTPHNRYFDEVRNLTSIKDFLNWQKKRGFDNQQLRYLTGIDIRTHSNNSKIDLSIDGQIYFERAIAVLDKFQFTFVVEEYDSAIKIISDKLNWDNEVIPRVELNKSTYNKDEEFSSATLNLVHEVQKWDFLLYKYAKNKHHNLYENYKLNKSV